MFACNTDLNSPCTNELYSDAKGMAKSVHDELLAVLIEHGGYEKMAAIMELNKWSQEKRYLRDLVSFSRSHSINI